MKNKEIKMTKIDIFSGFLGAGKTTLIKKLIKEAYTGEKVVLIENEFGEIGIDGGFLRDSGIEITEMNSGCICCSLVGDFGKALAEVIEKFSPDRILIEPSGVGKLSDVIDAVEKVKGDAVLNGFTTVADVNKCKMYMKNFGEFYNNQIEYASSVILSHTDKASNEKISECVALLREHNADATIVTTSWDMLDGKQILDAIEKKSTLAIAIEKLNEEETCPVCHHHHAHGEHHHHDGEECHCHDEHHHHHDGEECHCHDEHHHHHADEVFSSVGFETTAKYTKEKLTKILSKLEKSDTYGMILRAKGIVASAESEKWIHFDYIPGEADIREGGADIIGRICVIGSKIQEATISELFKI